MVSTSFTRLGQTGCAKCPNHRHVWQDSATEAILKNPVLLLEKWARTYVVGGL